MGDEPNKSNPVIGVPDSQGMTLSRLGLWNDYVSRLRESSIAHRFATCDRTLFWISVEQLVGQDELSVAQLKRFVRLFRAKFAIELALKRPTGNLMDTYNQLCREMIGKCSGHLTIHELALHHITPNEEVALQPIIEEIV